MNVARAARCFSRQVAELSVGATTHVASASEINRVSPGHTSSESNTDSRDSSINLHNKVRHEVMLVNTETGRIMSDRLVLIFLEMRNFVKSE